MDQTVVTRNPLVRRVEIIGVASGEGAPGLRSALGPDTLRAYGVAARLRALGRDADWTGTLHPEGAAGDACARVRPMLQALAQQVRAAVLRGALPLVLGGDHSCAIGTWKGIAGALAPRGPLGLIWIDAHMDAHTPATSASGRLHGMPVACLLGEGPPELTTLQDGMRLAPQHVCLIGVRSFEPDEARLLDRVGVRVFFMEEVARRGLHAVMEDALAIACRGTAGFGITIDLDAIDPRDAPGVETPVRGGLQAEELICALASIARDPALAGVEIAEFTPQRDRKHATAELATELIAAAVGGFAAPAGASRLVGFEYRYGAHHYDPLPVVLARGRGVYLWDTAGKRYLDMMSAYSAVSHGHCHPRLTRALARQARRLGVTSRVFHNEHLPLLLRKLCAISGQDMALPANTGLEAVEAALKAARKWAHKVKGVPEDGAEIIACKGNFHGRSIAILAMSSELQYRDGFGPFPPGFTLIPYGDAAALERAITPRTAALLIEPIQGEGGIIVPPPGYLARCHEICRRNNVLLICDEVQTGLGRTGRLFASQHDGVTPDGLILGKALGGGLLPVSAFLARGDVMAVFGPGDHGSTFAGNPLAAAVALEALDVLIEEKLAERAAEVGAYFLARLRALKTPLIRDVRGRGLLIGVEVDMARVTARAVCHKLLELGVLTKDTHHTVVRFAPPLVITRRQIDRAVTLITRAFAELERQNGG